ncbi:hypothetical protein DES53_104324 [Roseimicrobium gellanilyticum]|uniref:Uncharacterized protein n=1 Tax=Roseimicrobium gellanilyticum TaxID=748857 RepID=A0A366HNA5_9BACT|nr:hypothetical protein DES53_104324 [Roseimicrobium gellanilyticum]
MHTNTPTRLLLNPATPLLRRLTALPLNQLLNHCKPSLHHRKLLLSPTLLSSIFPT